MNAEFVQNLNPKLFKDFGHSNNNLMAYLSMLPTNKEPITS